MEVGGGFYQSSFFQHIPYYFFCSIVQNVCFHKIYNSVIISPYFTIKKGVCNLLLIWRNMFWPILNFFHTPIWLMLFVSNSNLYFLCCRKCLGITINMDNDHHWSVNQLLGTSLEGWQRPLLFSVKKINTTSTLEWR